MILIRETKREGSAAARSAGADADANSPTAQPRRGRGPSLGWKAGGSRDCGVGPGPRLGLARGFAQNPTSQCARGGPRGGGRPRPKTRLWDGCVLESGTSLVSSGRGRAEMGQCPRQDQATAIPLQAVAWGLCPSTLAGVHAVVPRVLLGFSVCATSAVTVATGLFTAGERQPQTGRPMPLAVPLGPGEEPVL